MSRGSAGSRSARRPGSRRRPRAEFDANSARNRRCSPTWLRACARPESAEGEHHERERRHREQLDAPPRNGSRVDRSARRAPAARPSAGTGGGPIGRLRRRARRQLGERGRGVGHGAACSPSSGAPLVARRVATAVPRGGGPRRCRVTSTASNAEPEQDREHEVIPRVGQPEHDEPRAFSVRRSPCVVVTAVSPVRLPARSVWSVRPVSVDPVRRRAAESTAAGDGAVGIADRRIRWAWWCVVVVVVAGGVAGVVQRLHVAARVGSGGVARRQRSSGRGRPRSRGTRGCAGPCRSRSSASGTIAWSTFVSGYAFGSGTTAGS